MGKYGNKAGEYAEDWEDYGKDYAKEKLIEAAKKFIAGGSSVEQVCSCTGLKKDFE